MRTKTEKAINLFESGCLKEALSTSSAPSASDSPKKNAEHCKLQVKVLQEMGTSTNS